MSGLIYSDHLPDNYQHPQRIRVTFDTLELFPTAVNISKEDVDLQWENTKPTQFKLSVQKRSKTFSYNALMKQWTVQSTYEVTNRGEGIIKSLKLRQDILDAQGKVIDTDEHLVTYSSEPYIAPQETRLEYFIDLLKLKPQRTRLTVVEIN